MLNSIAIVIACLNVEIERQPILLLFQEPEELLIVICFVEYRLSIIATGDNVAETSDEFYAGPATLRSRNLSVPRGVVC